MTNAQGERGIVFNIQRYSIHDGPGIRTGVFLKGCFLRCIWCQNPESQSPNAELLFFAEKCTGCGGCVAACPAHAVRMIESKSVTARGECKGSGNCVQVCPHEARDLTGKEMTAAEVFRTIKSDEIFYKRSNGGVTLTGGEPLFQAEFSKNILSLCRQAGMHTTIETCGYAEWKTFKNVLQYTDLVLYDLKHMDSTKHREYTGVPNHRILENAGRIHRELGIPLWIRIPVVPGYNDSVANFRETARFIAAELDKSGPVHLLAYHRLGESKYERLGMTGKDSAIVPPAEEHMLELRDIIASYGLQVKIGG